MLVDTRNDNDLSLSVRHDTPKPREIQESLPKRIFKNLTGKIGINIGCGLFVAMMANMGYIKPIIAWVCSLGVAICGGPEASDSMKAKIRDIVIDGAEVVKEELPPKSASITPATPLERLESLKDGAAEKAKEQVVKTAVAPIREATEQKVEEVKEEIAETGNAIKQGAEQIAGRMNPLGFGSVPVLRVPEREPLTPEQLEELEEERAKQTVLERRRARQRKGAQNLRLIYGAQGQITSAAGKMAGAQEQAQQQFIREFQSGGRN